jgi:pilus assembly protein HofN
MPLPLRWLSHWASNEMARPVNLLRWREIRRRDCLRFWGLLFVGSWLIAMTLIIAVRAGQTHQRTWQALRQESNQTLLQTFIQRERQLKVEHQRREALQEHERRRESTYRWQSTLLILAEQMPEQAWLTAMQWQGDSLSFSGLANRFSALSQIDRTVRSLSGFRSITPGATRRDEQGRWQFSYQLQVEVNDVDAR